MFPLKDRQKDYNKNNRIRRIVDAIMVELDSQ